MYTLHTRVHNICNLLFLLLLLLPLLLNLTLKPSGNSNFRFIRGCYSTLGYSSNWITPRDSSGGTWSLPATSSRRQWRATQVRRYAHKHTGYFTSTTYCTTKITLCRWHTNVCFPSNKSQIHKLPLHLTLCPPSTCFLVFKVDVILQDSPPKLFTHILSPLSYLHFHPVTPL
jgi:hypothetical protein